MKDYINHSTYSILEIISDELHSNLTIILKNSRVIGNLKIIPKIPKLVKI